MLKFAVIFCLIVAVAVQAEPKNNERSRNGNRGPPDGGPKGGFGDKQKMEAMAKAFDAEPRACNPMFLINAKDCANVPVVFSKEVFGKCGGHGKNGSKKDRRRKTRDAGSEDGPGSSEEGKDRGKGHGPLCMAECALNITNHLDAEGNINFEAIKASYAQQTANSPEWAKIAEDAITACMANVTSQPPIYASSSASNTQECSDKPIRFITCIQRQFVLNAPPGEQVTTTPSSQPKLGPPLPTCEERKSKLQNCDPNFIIQMPKGKNGKLQKGPKGRRNGDKLKGKKGRKLN
ncbi:Hypothetical predicted protein [Cloeon dipterum]|uniref:OBP47-like domain-containing protein n=1 Tax=Cloeon dipterum TaxID=197152 RepID=A0A8S1CIK2_9INSE|nr:Hypothetical predicted protein [Cloeon dipterum]